MRSIDGFLSPGSPSFATIIHLVERQWDNSEEYARMECIHPTWNFLWPEQHHAHWNMRIDKNNKRSVMHNINQYNFT